MHHFENKFKIPQGGDEQFVFIRTFRHISRSFSILWVKLRTQQLSESGLPCQTLTPDQNLVNHDIHYADNLKNNINKSGNGQDGREGGCLGKKVRQKSKKVFHFLLNLWRSLSMRLLYITVWWLYHTAFVPPLDSSICGSLVQISTQWGIRVHAREVFNIPSPSLQSMLPFNHEETYRER